MASRALDLMGQKFGRLMVISRADNHITPKGTQRARWLCRCECGTEVTIHAQCLRRGATKSCGCLGREVFDRLHRSKAGEANPNWRGDEVTYMGTHRRVRRVRGGASVYTCVDCADAAEEWSYIGGCPLERISDTKGSLGYAYSPDPARYAPRCKSCHRRYDQAMRDAA